MTDAADENSKGGTVEKNPLQQREPALEVADERSSDEDDADAEKPAAKSKSIPGVATLKAYKELIAIVLFFGGGIIWLYAAFATKHYVASIRCLLGATIERIDNEAQARVFQDEIVARSARIEELKSSNPIPTAALISNIEKLKAEKDGFAHRKNTAEEIVAKSASRILNGECDK